MPASTRFTLVTRETQETQENSQLATYAVRSRGAHQSRLHQEPEHPYRTAYQRDRDRIVHSRAFRRLKHKRQVFLTSESDHYRTRITHTLEVAQLSRTMARALGLNEDLVEAIALGHDLGHTPFGHLGEVILDNIMTGKRLFSGQKDPITFGGFKHNYQSVRVVDELERKYPFKGLNLTSSVREGILKHTRLKRGSYDFPDFRHEGLHFQQDMATTLEGQVVAICDEIAQRTHDLEDGVRAGLAPLDQVRELRIVKTVEAQFGLAGDVAAQEPGRYVGTLIRALINFFMDDVLQVALRNIADFERRKQRLQNFDEELLSFSAELDPLQNELNKFIYQEIIHFSRVKWSDELGEKLLFRLFEGYHNHPEFFQDAVSLNGDGLQKHKMVGEQADARSYRAVCDYIAGMTDSFAFREAERLARAKVIKIDDLKLESAHGHSE